MLSPNDMDGAFSKCSVIVSSDSAGSPQAHMTLFRQGRQREGITLFEWRYWVDYVDFVSCEGEL